MLEKYVNKLLEGAFEDSPLFWHYAVRHVPSDSLLCEQVVEPQKAMRTLQFREIQSSSETALLPVINPLPLYGYDAFPLGGVDEHCFCGWTLDISTNECIIPALLCQERNLSPCRLPHQSAELHAFTDSLMGDWTTTGTWECPETDLSDSWGIVPTIDAAAWIAQDTPVVQVLASDLLSYGMGGLRIGNANTLGKQAREQGVHPGKRVDPLKSLDGLSSISLKNCESGILKRFNATSVADEIVDDLFPMAQGIQDSYVESVCLRFSIEYLRLRVMQMISGGNLQVTLIQSLFGNRLYANGLIV